jgi:hypothetical protein
MRAAPERRPPPTARHAPQPRTSTRHPPKRQDEVHSAHLDPHCRKPAHNSRRALTRGRPRHAATARGSPPGDARRQPRVSPQQWQATCRRANNNLCPGTGKGVRADAGPPHSATRPAAGRARDPPPPATALSTQPPTPRPLPTTTGWREGRCPVVSNRPLHCVMQQRCHHASASARSPSSPTMPRPLLQRAATARQEKFQVPIAEQNFLILR